MPSRNAVIAKPITIAVSTSACGSGSEYSEGSRAASYNGAMPGVPLVCRISRLAPLVSSIMPSSTRVSERSSRR